MPKVLLPTLMMKTSINQQEAHLEKQQKFLQKNPSKNKMDQTRIHASPIGNFLNLNHQYSKNSFYQIFNDKGVPFLAGRLTANGVIKVKSLSKGIYQLQINNKPILWFVKQ